MIRAAETIWSSHVSVVLRISKFNWTQLCASAGVVCSLFKREPSNCNWNSNSQPCEWQSSSTPTVIMVLSIFKHLFTWQTTHISVQFSALSHIHACRSQACSPNWWRNSIKLLHHRKHQAANQVGDLGWIRINWLKNRGWRSLFEIRNSFEFTKSWEKISNFRSFKLKLQVFSVFFVCFPLMIRTFSTWKIQNHLIHSHFVLFSLSRWTNYVLLKTRNICTYQCARIQFTRHTFFPKPVIHHVQPEFNACMHFIIYRRPLYVQSEPIMNESSFGPFSFASNIHERWMSPSQWPFLDFNLWIYCNQND